MSQDFSVQFLLLPFLFLSIYLFGYLFMLLLFFFISRKNRITSSLCQDEFGHVGSSAGQSTRREIQNLQLKLKDLFISSFSMELSGLNTAFPPDLLSFQTENGTKKC